MACLLYTSRPGSRGTVMNPCDHPHGGGEGRAPVGHSGPMTPWGKPALGRKTRKHHKLSLIHICEPRYRGKRARLLAGKGLSGRGVSGFPQGSCKTAPVWGIV